MSDQLFEVAFSGKITEGADAEAVKAKVGKMFNADEAKIAQLFSGKRIIIKKNIDEATAAKYKTALTRAGADCEIRKMGGSANESDSATSAAAVTAAKAPPPASTVSSEYETQYDGEVAPPPQTDPLGITGDQIDDLSATLAPVGSELQSEYDNTEEPAFDLSGLDVAPVGSDLSSGPKKSDPPPPDTTGITMEE
ncbi:MAG: hypothetical protein AAF353_01580 [Pseudomonadota bacterium]